MHSFITEPVTPPGVGVPSSSTGLSDASGESADNLDDGSDATAGVGVILRYSGLPIVFHCIVPERRLKNELFAVLVMMRVCHMLV